MGILRRIMGDPDKSKVVVQTSKGGAPIRKVKFAIGAGVLASILAPIVEPFLLNRLGYVPEGITTAVARWLIESYELIAALSAAYMARPGIKDGISVLTTQERS